MINDRGMPDFELEQEHGGRVAGVDEVGRGPLAGPVVAAAVVFGRGVPADLAPLLDDSKKLDAAARETAYAALLACAARDDAEIAVAAASVAEIDRINILRASLLAMTRAIGRLRVPPALALVDGNVAPSLGCAVRTVVGGDARSFSIAAASIVAKVTRDRLMVRLDRRWPGYGWDRNAGYATPPHLAALRALGPTRHHRPSFGTVRQLALVLDPASALPAGMPMGIVPAGVIQAVAAP